MLDVLEFLIDVWLFILGLFKKFFIMDFVGDVLLKEEFIFWDFWLLVGLLYVVLFIVIELLFEMLLIFK